MILAEKLAQKLNNLKSKKELQDFFIHFDEARGIEITTDNHMISTINHPTTYNESSTGSYLIIWDDHYLSKGNLHTSSVDEFDDFIDYARKSKIEYSGNIFIPERGIYPFAITYAKTLADMIDIPEYLLKVSDITAELFKMANVKYGNSNIKVNEGVRYAYSSRNLDENYSYTTFNLNLNLDNKIHWQIPLSDTFPLSKFHEIFSLLGDIYVVLDTQSETKIKKDQNADLLIAPSVFRKIFNDQIIKNISGANILDGKSLFMQSDFVNKIKVLGTFSMSYDPLINNRLGTYRFTKFGFKPKRQYFIKFGKLDTPILDSINYEKLGYKEPSVEINDFQNIRIEGIKKKLFDDIKVEKSLFVLGMNDQIYRQRSSDNSVIHFTDSVVISGGKILKYKDFSVNINLIELIKENRVELIEYPDNQLGCKIKGFSDLLKK